MPYQRGLGCLLLACLTLGGACAAPAPAPVPPDPCVSGDASAGIEDLQGSYRIHLLATSGPYQGHAVDASLYLQRANAALEPMLYGRISSSLRSLGVAHVARTAPSTDPYRSGAGNRRDGTYRLATSLPVLLRQGEGRYDLLLGFPQTTPDAGLVAHLDQVGSTGFGGGWTAEVGDSAERSQGTFCAVRRSS